ncbi:MAG: hypothetical protein N3G20_04660, partial [Verrucomicrobiae bacterium]|nr:hypothetical protein [Verrucomicrobiae bacterium]
NIYRWANDDPETMPEAVYIGNPGGGRWGDNFDVRGAGLETQIIAAQRSGNGVAVFTTPDGYTFYPTFITVADAAQGNFGLGICFGPGNTFFGKATGQTLRRVQFDLTTATGTTLNTYTSIPTAVGTIGWDNTNNFLAALAFENPDNVRLYDMNDIANPVLIDQEFCAADNPNLNGTGQIDFGGGMLFVLNSNNGITAYTVKKPTPKTPATLTEVKIVGPNIEFVVTGEAGALYRLESSSNLRDWIRVPDMVVTGPSAKVSIPMTANGQQFFRAVLE